MKSKYFDYLDSRKESREVSVSASCFVITTEKREGKRMYCFEFSDMKVYFEKFSSLNDFMLSNGFA